jgi:nitroreductase
VERGIDLDDATRESPLLALVRRRTSIRDVDPRPIDDDDLLVLLEAARWSPSWGNLQPWRMVVVQDQAKRNELAGAYTRGNAWAAVAPVIVAMCGSAQQGKSRGDEPFYLFDCGLATQSLILAAAERGLVAHPFGGWDDGVVRSVLAIPPDFRAVVIAVGKLGLPDEHDETAQSKASRPHERKPLAELIFLDQWQQPFYDPAETEGD